MFNRDGTFKKASTVGTEMDAGLGVRLLVERGWGWGRMQVIAGCRVKGNEVDTENADKFF